MAPPSSCMLLTQGAPAYAVGTERSIGRRQAVGEFVKLEIGDGIGTIRLGRPPMNALNTQVQEELRAAAQEAAGSEEVRAVIVYGGEKVFAAGADITEFTTTTFQEMTVRAA